MGRSARRRRMVAILALAACVPTAGSLGVWAQDQPTNPETQPGGGHTVSPPTPNQATPPPDQPPEKHAPTATVTTTGVGGVDLRLHGYGDYKLNLGYGDKPVGNVDLTTTACRYGPAGGWFEPMQGVYQDDPQFPKTTWDFAQGPNDNPVVDEVGPGAYNARLPMIAGRHTVVLGVIKYRSKGQVTPAYRHESIVFKGAGDCEGYEDVRFKLTLTDIKGTRVVWTSPERVGSAPIAGAAGQSGPFQVLVDAYKGLPDEDAGAFTIAGPGDYTLTAELVKMDGSPTGLKLTASGKVLVSHPPVVEFIPVTLSGFPPAAQINDFSSFVDDVTEASHNFLPDYFPLQPDDLPTFSHDMINLAKFDPHLSDKRKNADGFSANLTDRLGAAAVHSQATRVVIFVRDGAQGAKDYERLRPGGKSAAFASSTKVVFIGVEPPSNGTGAHGLPPAAPTEFSVGSWGSSIVETVGHELNHTEPELLWSSDADASHNMATHCGLSEHNSDDKGYAFGVRIDTGGIEHRNLRDGYHSMMGSQTDLPLWISQCTYAHLISAFQKSKDPAVMMVRAIVTRDNGVMSARLSAGYDLDSNTDSEAAPAKDWAIVVHPAGGKPLTYPFEPPWVTEEALTRDTVANLVRIPDPRGAGRLEIVYGGKVLASRSLPAHSPSLSVGPVPATASKGQSIHLAWSATGAGPILSSVYYSNNKGRWYVDQLFEESANQFDVKLDPRSHDHVIKIVVTDGARSSQRLFPVTTP
ncbi:MAG: hypothetical protein ACHP7N_10385 [Caulobacterales bacterium]